MSSTNVTEETSRSGPLAVQAAVDRLEGLYMLKQEEEVRTYLAEHDVLVDLLLEAVPYLRKWFPDESLLVELITDPDSDAQQLAVLVATSTPVGEAVGKLRSFDQDWWLDNVVRAGGKLCIDTEFV